jgi:hypothetical protein
LHPAVDVKAAAAGVEFAAAAAERMLQETDGALKETDFRPAEATPQNDEGAAPFGTAPVLQTQSKLVAGAGFEPAAFRL